MRSANRPGSCMSRICKSKPLMVVLVLAATSQGCASFSPAQPDKPLSDQVEVGDRVRIVTTKGEDSEFVVTGVDSEGLYDTERYLPFEDLANIEIRKDPASEPASIGRAAAIFLGIILVLDAVGVGDAD